MALLYVFAGSLALLSWSAGEAGIAAAYVDPVAKIQAQDEGTYGSTSLEMAAHGNWLTPRLLGRYSYYKPPLLYWLQAAWAKFAGPGVWALRLPSLVAGAGAAALVFAWLLFESGDLASALLGAVLMLSNHLFFTLSRLGITDALLLFWITLAMFALSRSPRLDSAAALWTFGAATGAAVMTKGIAGLFPLLALGLFSILSRERPAWLRLFQAAAISVAFAAPWFLYQLAVHPRWFWADYVLTELLPYGIGAMAQTTQESQIGFYAKRLALLDAPLLAAALLSLVWKRPRLVLAWIAIVLAAALVFRYRNISYLLPAYPALAILAAGAIPVRYSKWALAAAVALFGVKLLQPAQPWGIPWDPEFVNPSDAALTRYAALYRGNDLIVMEPDDQFYSACLGLPHVRYAYVDTRPPRPAPLDLHYLGILITAPEFARLPELRPEFERRLREMGLNSGDPIATTILAPTEDSMGALIRGHPDADFFLPGEWVLRDQGVHQTWPMRGARAFLLARKMIHRP